MASLGCVDSLSAIHLQYRGVSAFFGCFQTYKAKSYTLIPRSPKRGRPGALIWESEASDISAFGIFVLRVSGAPCWRWMACFGFGFLCSSKIHAPSSQSHGPKIPAIDPKP